MRQFKLGIFKFPGCYVICNTGVHEHGDFQNIAHVSFAGNINYLVSENSIPQDARDRIKRLAAENREEFINKLDKNIELFTNSNGVYHNPYILLDHMLDKLTWKEEIEFSKNHKNDDVKTKLLALKPIYIARS